MPSAEELLRRWRAHAPAEADKGDVLKVIEAHLPGRLRAGKVSGSHAFKIDHPWLEQWIAFERPAVRGDCLSIPVVHGRRVKRRYVGWLVDFIDFVERGREAGLDEEEAL